VVYISAFSATVNHQFWGPCYRSCRE